MTDIKSTQRLSHRVENHLFDIQVIGVLDGTLTQCRFSIEIDLAYVNFSEKKIWTYTEAELLERVESAWQQPTELINHWHLGKRM